MDKKLSRKFIKLVTPKLESRVKIKITGLKKPLNFTLINMHEYLEKGGLIQMTFNGTGTIFGVWQCDDKRASL